MHDERGPGTRIIQAGVLGLATLVTISTFLLSGCAVQNRYAFSPKAISRVTYNPKDCKEQPDGTFRCKQVVFTVNAIQPK